MKTIDLNVDIGEGFPYDRELLTIASSANVCCGIHAGSAVQTEETVNACIAQGVRIGIHPGYPDRNSFGRASLPLDHQRDYLNSIMEQIHGFVDCYPASYLKPHGGFYNDLAVPIHAGWDSMTRNPGSKSPYEAGGQALSKVPGTGALILALRIHKIPLLGLAGTMHEVIANRAGVPFIKEGFADRRLKEDGTLIPRGVERAIITDEFELIENGLNLAETCDSLCIHGDTEGAVQLAAKLREKLESAGYSISCGAPLQLVEASKTKSEELKTVVNYFGLKSPEDGEN